TGSDGLSGGDGGPGVMADLNIPTSVAVDGSGNLFIADTNNHRIRKLDTTGIITTVAGDGNPRFFGDNGPARTASLNSPHGIYFDSRGNLLIADTGNQRIRRIDANGIISTIAGNGEYGFSADGTSALAAQLAGPKGIAVDVDDNLFIADSGNSRIRKITRSDSRIRTIAGTGEFQFYGDGGPAAAAGLSVPGGVLVDGAGNVLIADFENRRLRKIDATTGIITTIAGNGEGAFLGDNVPATTAVINYPLALTFDAAGNLFVGDSDNRVRKIDMVTGLITIFAGGGNPPDGIGDGGPARESDIFPPSGLVFDRDGNLYVADTGHARIRKIEARTNLITTIAGTGVEGFSGDGGAASAAMLNSPRTLAIDRSGNLYIADEGNRRVRKIDKMTGTITTVAGNGSRGYSGDQGPANLASLSPVQSIVLDTSDNLFIADYENERVRRVDSSTQTITTVAGGGMLPGNGGVATDVDILPISLAFDGRLFIMELVRQAIVRVGVNNMIAPVMGNGEAAFSGDSGPATAASLSYPAAMAFDRFGNLFIADSNNNRIRAVRGPIP
ncbi:MAG TPA: hypothetical protein VER98_13230, partial [Terriglobia bacterium]|nr:hypothetical protein [Terriglobia bacterium]